MYLPALAAASGKSQLYQHFVLAVAVKVANGHIGRFKAVASRFIIDKPPPARNFLLYGFSASEGNRQLCIVLIRHRQCRSVFNTIAVKVSELFVCRFFNALHRRLRRFSIIGSRQGNAMLTAGQHKAAKQCNKSPHYHVDLPRDFIVLLYIAFQIMSRSSAISKRKLTFCRNKKGTFFTVPFAFIFVIAASQGRSSAFAWFRLCPAARLSLWRRRG